MTCHTEKLIFKSQFQMLHFQNKTLQLTDSASEMTYFVSGGALNSTHCA